MNRRVVYFLIVLLQLKVRKNSVASIRVWHNFPTPINKSFIIELFEHMPNRFHESDIHGFIVFFKINPPSESFNNILPFLWVSHNNSSASLVVFLNTHLVHVLFVLNFQLFIDLVFDWQTVTIPSESSRNVVTGLGSIAANNVFNSACCDVTVMRSSSSEGRSIVKSIWW